MGRLTRSLFKAHFTLLLNPLSNPSLKHRLMKLSLPALLEWSSGLRHTALPFYVVLTSAHLWSDSALFLSHLSHRNDFNYYLYPIMPISTRMLLNILCLRLSHKIINKNLQGNGIVFCHWDSGTQNHNSLTFAFKDCSRKMKQ